MESGESVERRYQVFVSSTYVDLVDERRAVIQALLELDCMPAGMEMFHAANEDQWTLIREVIDLSDYYLVIVGGRYGSTTAEGISYTEMEYDYAIESGIPVLGFVHADPGSIPADMSELDQPARDKLEAFREKVMSRMVKEYHTPDELASVVSRALIRAIKHTPRPGWVRGDHALTDATRAEIAELRAALADSELLRSEAARAEAQGIDTSFAHGTDKVALTFDVTFFVEGAWDGRLQTVEIDFTWDDIVNTVGPVILDEASEEQMQGALEEACRRHLVDMPDSKWDTVRITRVAIARDSWGHVLVQLRALGLIHAGQKKRTIRDTAVYWALTRAGDDYLVRLKATPRPSD